MSSCPPPKTHRLVLDATAKVGHPGFFVADASHVAPNTPIVFILPCGCSMVARTGKLPKRKVSIMGKGKCSRCPAPAAPHVGQAHLPAAPGPGTVLPPGNLMNASLVQAAKVAQGVVWPSVSEAEEAASSECPSLQLSQASPAAPSLSEAGSPPPIVLKSPSQEAVPLAASALVATVPEPVAAASGGPRPVPAEEPEETCKGAAGLRMLTTEDRTSKGLEVSADILGKACVVKKRERKPKVILDAVDDRPQRVCRGKQSGSESTRGRPTRDEALNPAVEENNAWDAELPLNGQVAAATHSSMLSLPIEPRPVAAVGDSSAPPRRLATLHGRPKRWQPIPDPKRWQPTPYEHPSACASAGTSVNRGLNHDIRKWLEEEDSLLDAAVARHGNCWTQVAKYMTNAGFPRNVAQCRNRQNRRYNSATSTAKNACSVCHAWPAKGHTCTGGINIAPVIVGSGPSPLAGARICKQFVHAVRLIKPARDEDLCAENVVSTLRASRIELAACPLADGVSMAATLLYEDGTPITCGVCAECVPGRCEHLFEKGGEARFKEGTATFLLKMNAKAYSYNYGGRLFKWGFAPSDSAEIVAYPELTIESAPFRAITKLSRPGAKREAPGTSEAAAAEAEATEAAAEAEAAAAEAEAADAEAAEAGVVSQAEGMTLRLSARTSTGYTGVVRYPDPDRTKPFRAEVKPHNGRRVSLGTFVTAVEAAVAYAKHAAGPESESPEQTGIVTGSEAEGMTLYRSARNSISYSRVKRHSTPNLTKPFGAETEAAEVEVVSEAEGMQLHLSAKNSTGYKGVKRHILNGAKPYGAEICRNSRCYSLGYFGTAVEAAIAYAKDAESSVEDSNKEDAEVEVGAAEALAALMRAAHTLEEGDEEVEYEEADDEEAGEEATDEEEAGEEAEEEDEEGEAEEEDEETDLLGNLPVDRVAEEWNASDAGPAPPLWGAPLGLLWGRSGALTAVHGAKRADKEADDEKSAQEGAQEGAGEDEAPGAFDRTSESIPIGSPPAVPESATAEIAASKAVAAPAPPFNGQPQIAPSQVMWTEEEDAALDAAVARLGRSWTQVAKDMENQGFPRNVIQCRDRQRRRTTATSAAPLIGLPQIVPRPTAAATHSSVLSLPIVPRPTAAATHTSVLSLPIVPRPLAAVCDTLASSLEVAPCQVVPPAAAAPAPPAASEAKVAAKEGRVLEESIAGQKRPRPQSHTEEWGETAMHLW